MAEMVQSMARLMLRGTVKKATSATADEMSLLMGVRKFMKDELKTMQAFLVAAEAMKNKNMLLKVWAEQVRDLSYAIEDCLDEFMVHVGSQSLSRQLMKLKDRHRIAIQIRDLKSRVEEVSMRNTRYNLIKPEGPNTNDEVDSYMEDVCNHSASNVDEADLVGFAKPKEELIKLMDVHNDLGHAKVICVVGMGGLGKTTLARKTYESKEHVVNSFSSCAWITVSQSFAKKEMLKDMIRQLLGDESLKRCLSKLEGKTVQIEDLAEYLTEKLKDKRYFIVLDDLWTIDAWRWITSIAFPSSNIKGSRIIVTTRDLGLAKQCTSESLIYHLKPLQIDGARNLLLRKSRQTQRAIENDENTMTLVTKIVKKCGCLPLAILAIGGILATKQVAEWRHFYNQLPSELETNPTLEAMRRILTLSFNHLPSHLKSCFLYLSIFPEDFEIQRRRLVERWIAEGYVRANERVSIEDAGVSYFNELINRSLIQPSRVDTEGIIQSCRVHDIMLDVMLSISRDENFVYLARDNVTSSSGENYRHIAYHGDRCPNIGMDWSHVRSLTVLGQRPMEFPSLCSPNLKMLRTLDLEAVQFKVTQNDINSIGLLRHLKYVNIRQTNGYPSVYKLPGSIGKLQGLLTLDMQDTCIVTLPAEISRLHRLRSLRCSRKGFYSHFDLEDSKKCLAKILRLPMILTPLGEPDERADVVAELHMNFTSLRSKSKGVRVPRGIGNLKELQILEVVDIKRTGSKAVKELGELMQLKELSVVTQGASEKKCKILCRAIEKLSPLCSLNVDSSESQYTGGTLEWLHCISSPPPLLRTLELNGCLGEEIPDWFGNLTNLVNITLRGSNLKGVKTMEILGALPNLMFLRLYWQSCVAKKLVFKAGAFPSIRKLDIYELPVREIRFEKGAAPKMEMIEIWECNLWSGISGVNQLPRLKEISLGFFGRVVRLGLLQEELDKHPNHPVLRMPSGRGLHELRDDIYTETEGSSVEEEEAPESSLPEPEGEVTSRTVDSEDDLLYTYNSC
ncbi:hypothetical protein ACQ4PT_067449 [Festuca glaucescens]